MGRKVTIEPVTRVEGHGKVTIHLDDSNQVVQSRLHIVEFRGFERFVQGRPYWEAPVLVQRLCGICPVSHHLAAAKALDVIVGAKDLTPTAEKMRRLMHYGQIFQSHSLHFFHLVSPDLLFGIDAPPEKRNVIAVAAEYPELGKQAVFMRKFGQEIIKATSGKKIHGTGAIPGGINKHLTAEERDRFIKGEENLPGIEQMIEWSLSAIEFFKGYYSKNKHFIDTFAAFPSSHLSIVRKDGAMDLYNGVLRAVDSEGRRILNDVDNQEYAHHIAEGVKNWSYMKFPFLKHLGPEKGWYRVGPMARLATADFIPTPRAQKAFEDYQSLNGGKPSISSMHMHYARLIEILHSAEVMKDLLHDPDLLKDDLLKKGTKTSEGVGIIEAPRGTLFHHYRINSDDQITMANLIVSTTNNNEPMNMAVDLTAKAYMAGNAEITEPMMNAVEVAIRAYDPCLSCATHALGSMPLEVNLVNSEGDIIDTAFRGNLNAGSCSV